MDKEYFLPIFSYSNNLELIQFYKQDSKLLLFSETLYEVLEISMMRILFYPLK